MADAGSAADEELGVLQFQAFSSAISVAFWKEFASLKLDKFRLSDAAQPVTATYSAAADPRIPSRLSFDFGAFNAADAPAQSSTKCLKECHVAVALHNSNTLEAFKRVDKNELLASVARGIWEDIRSGAAVRSPQLLLRALLLSYADLKRNTYLYWLAVPALVSPQPFRLVGAPTPLSAALQPYEITAFLAALNALRKAGGAAEGGLGAAEGGSRACPPFFVVRLRQGDGSGEGGAGTARRVEVQSLQDYEAEREDGSSSSSSSSNAPPEADGGDTLFGFIDPCPLPTHPGWPLRNFLALMAARWRLKRARVLCCRSLLSPINAATDVPSADEAAAAAAATAAAHRDASVVLHIDLSGGAALPDAAAAAAAAAAASAPAATGWELNAKGRPGPRMVDLSGHMDPLLLAQQSADLNLRLMRWRLLPGLAVEELGQTRCLILGAGTLGCNVARCLLGWGIRDMTFVDSGRVSFSNPVRQSLYEFADCLDGGKPKAQAAAEAVRRIFPGTRAEWRVLSIPMPGHPLSSAQDVESGRKAVAELAALVATHDVTYLLTDTRESRWLPTVLAAAADKMLINAALGLDTYLVQRHGGGDAPTSPCDPPAAPPTPPGPPSDPPAVPPTTPFPPSDTPAAPPAPPISPSDPPAVPPTPPSDPPAVPPAPPANELSAAAVEERHRARLGCYFCSDVVAPENSQRDRTIDQQCTVTRPGLAPIAAALAVELTVGLLHHPLRHRAPADAVAGGLGALPHQVRGHMASFSQATPATLAFDCCTGCGNAVVAEWRARGFDFVQQVCDSAGYLEELSGLAALQRAMDHLDVDADWDDE